MVAGVRRRIEPRAIVMAIVLAVLLIIVVYPLSLLLLHSLHGGFALTKYHEAFANPQNAIALGNSLYTSAVVTLLTVLIGTGMAWLITRSDLPFKRYFRGLIFLTFVTPPYIGTISWIQLLGRAGYLNAALMRCFHLSSPPIEIYSLEGIIAVMAIYLYPLVFWAAANALTRTDPSLEDAAAASGGTRWKVFTTITLPLALPSILSAALLVFIHTIACFSVAAALGLPTRHYVLATRIYAALSHYDVQMACVLSVILGAYSGGAFLLHKAFTKGGSYITTTSGSKRPESIKLGHWRLPVTVGLLSFILFTSVLPLLTLLSTSLLKVWGIPLTLQNMSLGNYLAIFQNKLIGGALQNSLIFAIIAAGVAVLLSFLTAYISTRTKLTGRGLLDLLVTFPLAIPGPVLATTMILAWMKPPLVLYNTPWIIIVAYVVAFTPFALRNLSGSFRSLDPGLEEAAWLSGASWLRGLKDVLLPLLKPGILTSFILVFLMGMREIPISLMLHTQGTETVGVVLFSFRETIGVEAVSALAVIVILITLAGHLIVGRLSR
ncbi:iron ABC transporter permease, partial [Candidatus Bipolaricaulota bacterium]|nr:iron ABC transporter permease [Candidatus Bipolaricaulota bacterium]